MRVTRRKFGALIGGVAATPLWSQERTFSLRVVQSGHSLTDVIMEPLRGLVASQGIRNAVIDKSTVPGATLEWRWQHNDQAYDVDAKAAIANYDIMVLTEGISLSMTLKWHDTPRYAKLWYDHAWENGRNGNGAETILYASWIHTDSGPNFENPYGDHEGHIPFRPRLEREMLHWRLVQSHVNENRPQGAPYMRMIPGPMLIAAIYDEIAAGRAPGLSDISDLFIDTIHLNEVGGYYMALAHYAVIYNRDPRGLQNSAAVTPQQARWMQQLVWDVLSREEP